MAEETDLQKFYCQGGYEHRKRKVRDTFDMIRRGKREGWCAEFGRMGRKPWLSRRYFPGDPHYFIEVWFDNPIQAGNFEDAWDSGVECLAHMLGVECDCRHWMSQGTTHTGLGASMPAYYRDTDVL